MKKLSIFLFLICFFAGNPLYSVALADDAMPDIIISGLKAYEKDGPTSAIEIWIKGSPFDGSKEALSQANRFKEIESFYGNYVGYNLIHITSLTPLTKIIYFSIDYQRGPVFCALTIYKSKNGWILTGQYNFHTDPTQILPASLLSR